MSRILGIDYGSKRIGVAISDPLQILATELGIIDNLSIDQVLDDFSKIFAHYQIEKIVIGLPLNMNGSSGFQAEIVKEFAKHLEQFDKPIIFVDERKSSEKAESIMKDLKVDVRKIRKTVDKKAAGIILQDYLDYQN